MSAIIKVENVSKRFVLNHEGQERYTALRDVLTRKAASLLKGKTGTKASKEEFWALNGVNFEIERGDRVGIIGRNGAGKSTLLKILSRITEPSSGRITIGGRVASLLEVGTGFHPELTGRENIFLNGAILGMSRAEIRRKFDEIVDFAEVEKFLDTPVKRYSSGMYVRLAFAVAAHLEPEILVVDEVLAVGDAQFQKKCLGKMEDVSKGQGRTVIFVSHNMDAVRQLCNKGILLKNGQVALDAGIDRIVEEYLKSDTATDIRFPYQGSKPSITRISVDENDLKSGNFRLRVEFSAPFNISPPSIGVVISTKYGSPVFGTNARIHKVSGNEPMSNGYGELYIPGLPVHSDLYNLSVFLGDTNMDYDIKQDIMSFEFSSTNLVINNYGANLIGPLNITPEWRYFKS